MPEFELKVQKRDGGIESWNTDKHIASMAKSGVAIADAEAISKQVEIRARQTAINGIIGSSEIRDKTAEILKSQFPLEGDSYIAYKKG